MVEPSEDELTNYLVAHPALFEIPGHISFVQVYFNTDRRGKQAKKDIQRLLATQEQTESEIDIKQSGDPFMLAQEQSQLTEYEVTQLFGKDFASKLFTLAPGDWQGPVQSSFGLHLVRIDNKTKSSQAELKTVRIKVRNEWMNQQRRTANEAFYKSLRQRYEIVIEEPGVINYSKTESSVSDR